MSRRRLLGNLNAEGGGQLIYEIDGFVLGSSGYWTNIPLNQLNIGDIIKITIDSYEFDLDNWYQELWSSAIISPVKYYNESEWMKDYSNSIDKEIRPSNNSNIEITINIDRFMQEAYLNLSNAPSNTIQIYGLKIYKL